MGCFGNKPKIRYWNVKVNLPLESLFIEKLDKYFIEPRSIILSGEILRSILASKWVTILTLTGAIIIKSPLFSDVVDGMIWKISREYFPQQNEIIKNIKFDSKNTKNPIFVNFYDTLNDEIKDIVDRFNDFITILLKKYNEIDEILKRLQKEKLTIDIALIKDEKVYNGFKLTKSQQKEKTEIVKRNIDRITHCYESLNYFLIVGKEISTTAEKKFLSILEDKYLDTARVVAQNSKSGQLKSGPQIMWENTRKEKIKYYGISVEIIHESKFNNLIENEEHDENKKTLMHTHANDESRVENIVNDKDNKNNDKDNDDAIPQRQNKKQKTKIRGVNGVENLKEVQENGNRNRKSIFNINPTFKSRNSLIKDDAEGLKDDKILNDENEIEELNLKLNDRKAELDALTKKNEKLDEEFKTLEKIDKKEIYKFTPIFNISPLPFSSNFSKLSLKETYKVTKKSGIVLMKYISSLDLLVVTTELSEVIIFSFKDMSEIHKYHVPRALINNTIVMIYYMNDANNMLVGFSNGEIYNYTITSSFIKTKIFELEYPCTRVVASLNSKLHYFITENSVFKVNLNNNHYLNDNSSSSQVMQKFKFEDTVVSVHFTNRIENDIFNNSNSINHENINVNAILVENSSLLNASNLNETIISVKNDSNNNYMLILERNLSLTYVKISNSSEDSRYCKVDLKENIFPSTDVLSLKQNKSIIAVDSILLNKNENIIKAGSYVIIILLHKKSSQIDNEDIDNENNIITNYDYSELAVFSFKYDDNSINNVTFNILFRVNTSTLLSNIVNLHNGYGLIGISNQEGYCLINLLIAKQLNQTKEEEHNNSNIMNISPSIQRNVVNKTNNFSSAEIEIKKTSGRNIYYSNACYMEDGIRIALLNSKEEIELWSTVI